MAMQASISSACQLCVWPLAADHRYRRPAGMSAQYRACSAVCQTGLSPVALRASTISSAVMAGALLLLWLAWRGDVSVVAERAGCNEGAALVDTCGVVSRRHRLRFDLVAKHFRAVLGLEAQVRGVAVVPPQVAVVRHAVDHGVADVRGV